MLTDQANGENHMQQIRGGVMPAGYEEEKNTLDDPIVIRFFPGDRQRMQEFVDAFPDRFENVSHFVRCAVQFYLKNCRKDMGGK